MNAVMSFATAADQLQRQIAMRRKNAEQAYDRQTDWRQRQKQLVADVEALLRGERPSEQMTQSRSVKLNAGQVKQVHLPLSHSLEEAIDEWRIIRRDAMSTAEPTPADFQLAAKASARIRDAETQLSFQKQTEEELGDLTFGVLHPSFMKLPSTIGFDRLMERWKIERAISSYQFHHEAKERAYNVQLPQFYETA